ncbi:hypothetical protein [Streptomyces turgidiscabies]|uniref:hypothetical protein n=1 Tax=Streptomyces turgidiscabies TaxID=85558 RepID=UPI0038F715A4
MLKKVWESIALLVVLVVVVHLALASIQPWLPVLGIVVLGIITAALIRLVFFRKWFW